MNFGDIASGASIALSVETLAYCFAGVTLGTVIGILPGIGTLATLAMLMPLTFYLDPTTAIVMMAGINYGAAYGGSTASILLNVPGTASTAVTCLDGYPMARQGRASLALFITAIASFVGSIIGIVALVGLAYPLTRVALSFGSAEYFSLMVLGLVAASAMASSGPFRALSMVAVGIVIGLVGVDINSAVPRFAFGMHHFYDGLPLAALAIGLFGIPEIIRSAGLPPGVFSTREITFRSMLPTGEEWRRSAGAMARGGGIGTFFGALPGAGATIASFLSYSVEKRISRTPERFGKGAIEGVSAPEASNNSAILTAFIPTLTLGIPGDAVMALFLSIWIIHGIAPGPAFISGNPHIFWALIISFIVGNIILLVLNIPLIRIFVKIITVPYSILFPVILAFVCIGVYSVNYAVEDVITVMVIGLVGCGLVALRFPVALLLLGFILGPMMEENFRRAMILSRGDPTTFLMRPISGALLAACVLLVAWAVMGGRRRRRRADPPR